MRARRFFGHRSIKNTLKYIQLDAAIHSEEDYQFVCKAASTVEDAMSLIELGFEHVCGFGAIKLFRKHA